MTDAITGYGSSFEVHDGASPGAWFEFAEVKTIGLPNEAQERLDATHLQSPGRTREFIAGFIDPGEQTITMNWVPGSATDEFIIDWRASGETRDVRVTSANGVTFTYPAFPTGYETPIEEGVQVATLNLAVAGAVVRGTA